ncbi:MAG: TetR/AcrR family transcriptional regulator [Xenococcus sp. (in: cyanobacteria)]
MSKEQVITKIIPVFRHYGYEGATMSRLSEATGLKKASLYHHFQGGKEQIAEAVLEYIGNWINENVFAPLKSDRTPKERIEAMCQGIDKLYQTGQEPCVLSVMSVGEADNLFHQQLKQSLKKWIDTLAEIVEETGIEPKKARERAEDAIMLIQGALVLVRVSNNTEPFQRAIAQIPQILLEN